MCINEFSIKNELVILPLHFFTGYPTMANILCSFPPQNISWISCVESVDPGNESRHESSVPVSLRLQFSPPAVPGLDPNYGQHVD